MLELEFDFSWASSSTEDYEHLSRELLAEAGQALREERGSIGELDAEIEREIAAARAAFAAARRSSHPSRGPGTPSARTSRSRRDAARTVS